MKTIVAIVERKANSLLPKVSKSVVLKVILNLINTKNELNFIQ